MAKENPEREKKEEENARGRRMGWVKCRWLGASHSGAEPPGRSFPHAQELGASHSGAEPRVYFQNSFRQESIWEKLSKK